MEGLGVRKRGIGLVFRDFVLVGVDVVTVEGLFIEGGRYLPFLELPRSFLSRLFAFSSVLIKIIHHSLKNNIFLW